MAKRAEVRNMKSKLLIGFILLVMALFVLVAGCNQALVERESFSLDEEFPEGAVIISSSSNGISCESVTVVTCLNGDCETYHHHECVEIK